MKKNSAIWITWEKHRRTESLSSILAIPLYCLRSSLPIFLKHPWLLLRTFFLLLHLRPQLLFVQNPSAFLTIEAILLKHILGYVLVVDAHNAGVYPFEIHQKRFLRIFPFIHRYANLTIVTNSVLAAIINKNGGHSFVLPDPLPKFNSIPKPIKKREVFIVTFICSFAADEPYFEVMKSVQYLPDDVKVYITGNNRKLKRSERLQAGDNIVLTGFLEDGDFVQQLINSDVIMDLTTFQDCIVCGAYEGVSLGVPLILTLLCYVHGFTKVLYILTIIQKIWQKQFYEPGLNRII